MEKATLTVDQQTAKRQANARRTALLVGLIAMLVYGGFMASVIFNK